jgi:hypothetical protein
VTPSGSPPDVTAPDPSAPGPPLLEDRRPGPGRRVGFLLLFLAVASGLAAFSAFPWVASPPGVALLKVAVKHVASPVEASVTLSREELEKLPRHMRPASGQGETSRGRRDTIVRVTLDGRPVLDGTYRPGGLRGDGPTFVYEEVELRPGRYRLEASLAESGGPAGRSDPLFERRFEANVDVEPGRVLLLELSSQQELVLRR